MERVKSGIEGLDQLLDGGFPKGGTYAVLGFSGTGKSILGMQYLYSGANDYDAPGVYVLIEESKERFKSNMAEFGWDLQGLEDSGKIMLIPYTKSLMGDVETTFERGMMSDDPERAERLRQFLTVDSLYREIVECSKRIGAKRVVIDSMTIVTLLTNDQLIGRMQIMWLIDKLRKNDLTTLITLEEGISYWRDIPFLCDGTIYMMLKEKEGIFERGLVIEKMRGTHHDTGVRPLKIESPGGIRVYPDEVVSLRSTKH